MISFDDRLPRFLALLAFAAAYSPASPQTAARETERGCDHFVEFGHALYDTDHIAGIIGSGAATSDGDGKGVLGELTLYWGPEFTEPLFKEWSEATLTDLELGEPIIAQHFSALTDPFASWTTVTCAFPPSRTLVPVGSNQALFEMFVEPLSTSVQIFIVGWLGDEADVPTPTIHWANDNELFESRHVKVLAEYLPGNALHDVGNQEETYSEMSGFGEILAQWGATVFPGDGIVSFNPDVSPIGPMRISLMVDGYASDWIEFTVEDGKIYNWNALLVPAGEDPAPIASSYITPPEFSDLQKRHLVEWATTGQVNSFSNLTAHVDQNADEVWDAADMVGIVDSGE